MILFNKNDLQKNQKNQKYNELLGIQGGSYAWPSPNSIDSYDSNKFNTLTKTLYRLNTTTDYNVNVNNPTGIPGEKKNKFSSLFSKENATGTYGAVGNVADSVGNWASAGSQHSKTVTGMDTAYDMTSNAVSGMGPYGAAIGAGMKVNKALVGISRDKLGIKVDDDAKYQSPLAKMSQSSFGYFTPGSAMEYLGRKKTQSLSTYDNVATDAGFAGLNKQLEEGKQMAGKYYGFTSTLNKSGKGLFGGYARAQKELKDLSNKANLADTFVGEQNKYKQALGNDTQSNLLKKQKQLTGTNNRDLSKSIFAKEGVKLNKLDLKLKIKSKKEPKEKSKNVIPDGKLHAHKHNLDIEDISKKGIPVVSLDEGGNVIEQHAEVEVGEIILTKELTDKLEELRKIGTDEAKIKAGKLLSEELILNTEDNTNKLLPVEEKSLGGDLLAYQKGGVAPFITSDKKLYEKRKQLYNDSLILGTNLSKEKVFKKTKWMFNNTIPINYKYNNSDKKDDLAFKKSAIEGYAATKRKNSTLIDWNGEPNPGLWGSTKIAPIGDWNGYGYYQKPVQKVILDRGEGLKESSNFVPNPITTPVKTSTEVKPSSNNKPIYLRQDPTTSQFIEYSEKGDSTIIDGTKIVDYLKSKGVSNPREYYQQNIKSFQGKGIKFQDGGIFVKYEPFTSNDYLKDYVKEFSNSENKITLPDLKQSISEIPQSYPKDQTTVVKKLELPTLKSNEDLSSKEGKMKYIYKTLKDKGLTREHAIAILANIDVETGGKFDADTTQIGGGPGYGLMQMEKGNSRYDDMVKSTKGKQNDFKTQWNYVLNSIVDENEFNSLNHWGGYGNQDKFIKNNGSIEELTKRFGELYLRPGKPNWDKRIQSAKTINNLIK